MTKLLQAKVQVALNGAKTAPSAFWWRKRRYPVVAVHKMWRETGAWWQGEGERVCFRLAAQGGGIFDLYFQRRPPAWVLERVYD